jgi:squalene-hopene/tetraprenyl-beta-curcumene cyclase
MRERTCWKARSVLLVGLLLAASFAMAGPGAVADETLPPALPTVSRPDVEQSVIQGLDWLARGQSLDGSWGLSPGVTGLVVLAFAGAGFDYTNQTVQRALEYMRFYYNANEGILADAFLNYECAISIMAMSAAGDPQDADKIVKITEFMQDLQFIDNSPYNMTEEWYYGGWPNYAGIADISNSQFALLGLECAELYNPGIQVDPVVWEAATTFAHMCQNWPDLNTNEWAHNTSLPSHGDGGFVYNAYRSRTSLGEKMFQSYGSITAAGLFNYLVSGNDPTQPEVVAARDWLDSKYTVTDNPNMERKGTLYNLWTQSRVLAMHPQDWIVDSSGKLHDWRAETADHFIGIQLANGGWPGNVNTDWREGEPELASMYALLSMQSAYLMVPDPELTIEVEGGDTVQFVSPMGVAMSSDATKGLTVTGRTLTCTDPEVIRKVWVSVQGAEGTQATVTATGTWGDGRTARTARTANVGKAGASFHVATGGFSGPFGIHITALDDSPGLEVTSGRKVNIVEGGTKVVSIGLRETTSAAPVKSATLIAHVPAGIVADVTTQDVDVAPGSEGELELTISVPEGMSVGDDWILVVTSSTGPPIALQVGVEEPDEDESPTTMYWIIIVVLIVLVVVFFLLPKMGRKE